jgi:hypothetical protein
MKFAVVKFSDLIEDNPTLCLSALRGLNECQKCQTFQNKLTRFTDVKTTLAELKCKPHLSDEAITILNKRAKLIKKKREIEKELSEL